jgi:hypothetical protein
MQAATSIKFSFQSKYEQLGGSTNMLGLFFIFGVIGKLCTCDEKTYIIQSPKKSVLWIRIWIRISMDPPPRIHLAVPDPKPY